MRFTSVALALALSAAGCSGEGGNGDAATPRDSGPQRDSGAALDAASLRDGATSPDTGGTTGSDGATSPDTGAVGTPGLVGWWVWREQRDGDTVTPITDADMAWMVGPSGWPGCPEGISCTRTGIMVVGFSAGGDAHVMHRVTTGSDTQHPATYATEGDLLRFRRTEQFSCAHPPGGSAENAGDFFARFRREGEDLWLSVEGFGGLPFASSEPAATPARWIVFRPITQTEAHGRYDHPYCGAARKGVDSCNRLCDSTDVLADAR